MEALRAAALRVMLHSCAQELDRILSCNAAPEEHLSFSLSVITLADREPELAEALYARPLEVLSLLDDVTVQAQVEAKAALEKRYQDERRRQQAGAGQEADEPPSLNVHDNVHVRLVGLPSSLDPRPSPLRPPLSRLGCAQLQQLLSVAGTVVRAGPVRMWESNQLYECTRCKGQFGLKCSLEGGGAVELPDQCPIQRSPPCSGSKFVKVPNASIYSGFQEIRLQAVTACLGLGEPPASLTVILQDDLADAVKPGERVEVVGVLVHRWLSTTPGQRCDMELVLVANNISATKARGGQGANNAQLLEAASSTAGIPSGAGSADVLRASAAYSAVFQEFWAAHRAQPLLGRNKILAGVCPGVAGMLTAKLAVLLVLIGGVSRRDEGGTHIRGDLHLLLVGDPGTGKSQLMKWACRACPGRAVLTTGRGSSGAGLTVSAVRDNNSWALEAGALVLADGGLCCIDEFDGIRPAERAIIHEAMEQQTVHVAKAGLVTNLSTRTAVIGAINPRPGTTITCSRPLTAMTGLEGPLLSRFDLVLLLADPRKPDWDRVVAGHVLARGALASNAADPNPEAAPQDGLAGEPLALPPAEELMAPPPQLALIAGGAPLSRRQAASQAAPGPPDESRMSIAQRVAARLTGAVPGAAPPASRAHTAGDIAASPHWGQPASQQVSAGQARGECDAQDSAGTCGSTGSAWTLEVIRAYISWVRGRPPPTLTPEAERVLVAYYGAMRRAEDRSAERSTIRALESLIRLSQAHARLVCSEQVLLRDAIVAVALVDTSLQLLHIPGSDTVACARFPTDPDEELLMQQRVVMAALGLTCLLPAPPAPPPSVEHFGW